LAQARILEQVQLHIQEYPRSIVLDIQGQQYEQLADDQMGGP